MPANTAEIGLENLIVEHLRNNSHYVQGSSSDYNTDYALDTARLEAYLQATQPQKVAESLAFASPHNKHNFFERLKNEITKRGVIDVLRKGYRYNTHLFDMYSPLPSELNDSAKEHYKKNIFCVIRQLHYSKTFTNLSLDVAVFLNGMPLITFELKNQFTGQNVSNAIKQYRDREAKELIFMPKRCAVHFAVDDEQVMMCTELKGDASWFLPFNKGVDGSAGNPVNKNGLKTAYLWEQILTKHSLSDIVENYAQVIKIHDENTGRLKSEKCIWPRYHQLDAVRQFIKNTRETEIGKRFLIQHSAGSGKSNTITWLAYQLVQQLKDTQPLFNSVIIVTDRINLDKQIKGNIMAFNQLGNIVGWADSSETLRKELQAGKKIIITIVHKFQFILDTIGSSLTDKKFAIIIDEAHSSQNGSLSASMNRALTGNTPQNEDDLEEIIISVIEGRKMVKNANYYAFTATPKNKTLEMFGKPKPNVDGTKSFEPHHSYTMRQAIQEGFILDVLKNYTPYQSFYKVIKAVNDDPEFDKKQASKKLRWFVESRPETVEKKAAIIVRHFHEIVIGKGKIGGQARAMVVTAGIDRAIEYYFAITKQLTQIKSSYKPIIAFSGEKEFMGQKMTESSINGFSSTEIEARMKQDPYRILVVADKFQTGYDEPLLHTMYVDKGLSDIKAVQTLSRLNRSHPKKKDTFVLDFANDPEDIKVAFQRYYKMTSLSQETDPNKLNDLLQELDEYVIYSREDVQLFNKKYWTDAPREELDPILDACVVKFKEDLTENQQIACKGSLKAFVRTYTFLAAIMPFSSPEWEMLNTFYKFLVTKLPNLKAEDWTDGLYESINFDQLRVVAKEDANIELENQNAAIDPLPTTGGGGKSEPDLEKLSNILDEFNLIFGGIDWQYPNDVKQQILDLPELLVKNEAFSNAARFSDEDTAQMECNSALQDIIIRNMAAQSELSRYFLENEQFRSFLTDRVFGQAFPMVNR
ncbi:MAG: DEAD/DEAH box helicase family protein [Dysgonamonadaceae bacterium]